MAEEKDSQGNYNKIFERLVINEEDDPVLGVIAYGIYKTSKFEWTQDFYNANKRRPRATDLKAYVETWTTSQLDNARKNAALVLSEYADTVIAEAKPRIIETELRGHFWKGVWSSMVGAALYTVALIIIAILLKAAGIDLINIIKEL